MAYIFDILIVTLLALFAWRGWTKGLILSLCGLAAVFVAFFAAQFLSNQFYVPVSGIIRPILIQRIQGADAEPVTADPESGYTVDELLDSIREKGLFQGFHAFLEKGVASQELSGQSQLSPLERLADYLARAIARVLLFAIVYLAVVLGWFLASHALDLAFHLPILAEVNTIGGGLAGLVKGILLTIILVWLGQIAGVVPSPPDTPVLSLFTLQSLEKLLSNLSA